MKQKLLRSLSLCVLLTAYLLAMAQPKTISGTIRDAATGQPLSGVNINVKGTATTVVTDALGNYSLAVPSNESVLVFSYVGYGTLERPVGTVSTISLTMSSSQKSMDEVVVIGFGSTRRRDLTGAITSLKPDVITQTPTHNTLEAIQGRAAGVDVVSETL